VAHLNGLHEVLCLRLQNSHLTTIFAEIPEDEARYWTGKLERINAMGIHDEVRPVHVQQNNSMTSIFHYSGG